MVRSLLIGLLEFFAFRDADSRPANPAAKTAPCAPQLKGESPPRDANSGRRTTQFPAESSAISENTATSSLATASYSQHFRTVRPLQHRTRMILKIERILGGRCTIMKLIGRIRAEYIAELKEQIAANAPRIELELGEVVLVDADVVRSN
jgi:hypothetical protein